MKDPKLVANEYKNMNDSLWMLYSHIYYNKEKKYNDKDLILDGLINKGYKITDSISAHGAWGYKLQYKN